MSEDKEVKVVDELINFVKGSLKGWQISSLPNGRHGWERVRLTNDAVENTHIEIDIECIGEELREAVLEFDFRCSYCNSIGFRDSWRCFDLQESLEILTKINNRVTDDLVEGARKEMCEILKDKVTCKIWY